MPATPPRSRARSPLGVAVLAGALLGVTACTGLDEASAAGVTHEALVSEVAYRVAGADTLTWTATYRLAGGGTGRVTRSQQPGRTAYAFPSGHLIRTPVALTRCTVASEETVCTATDPARDSTDDLPATTGLVTPGAVLDMLEAGAIDPAVTVASRETTIAGRHASCLHLSGVTQAAAPDFEVCVTVEGAVAAFTGAIDGTRVEMVLTDYRTGTDESDFALPTGARFTDRRPS